MEADYYELTSELDAREILRYLNYLGIHNITGEVLKYFITDLKKLIKYDLEQKNRLKDQEYERPGPERLHSASTFSSRIRSKSHSNISMKCSRECTNYRRPLNVRNVHSAPALGRPKLLEEKPRRACSCTTVERKVENAIKGSRVTTNSGMSNNCKLSKVICIGKEDTIGYGLFFTNAIVENTIIIKVPMPQTKKKCDPVALYHYYSSLWEKYKPNVPGENNWADLRWHIRQKMAGCSTISENKNPEHAVKSKTAVKK